MWEVMVHMPKPVSHSIRRLIKVQGRSPLAQLQLPSNQHPQTAVQLILIRRQSSKVTMDYLGFGYAAVVAMGGVIGYVKAGSTVSLVMGLIFGGLSGVGAYQASQDHRNYQLLLASSGILMSIMGYRALNSGKFMPAGLVATLSLLMVLRLAPRMLS